MSEQDDLKTDIALIKKDVKQIERFFDKVDKVMDEMTDITKSLAVQQQIIEHFSSKLEDMEDRMEEHKSEDIKRTEVLHKRLDQYRNDSKEDHRRLAEESKQNRAQRNKEIMEELAKLNGNLEKRMIKMADTLEDQDGRIRVIENLKWWLLGAIAVVTFLAQFVSRMDLAALIS